MSQVFAGVKLLHHPGLGKPVVECLMQEYKESTCKQCGMFNCSCDVEHPVKLETRTNDDKILYLLQHLSVQVKALEQAVDLLTNKVI